MRESELYPPVKRWLEQQGYKVHVELFDCDVIGEKDGELVAVELKLCASLALINQLHHRAGWANYVWGVVPTDTDRVSWFKSHGFGLLEVRNGKVRVRCKARPQPWTWHKRRTYRLKKILARLPAMPHEQAGIASTRLLREQRLYRLNQPCPSNLPPV